MTDHGLPHTEELILATEGSPPAETWWTRYERSLADSGLTDAARSVIDADAEYILTKGILGAGPAGSGGWPASRVRTGLVMGAVQSGKTASMLGVGAKALDAGIQVLVILGGTRVALWRQTYERLLHQLGSAADSRRQLSLASRLIPEPTIVYLDDPANGPRDLYRLPSARARRALREGTPLVLVVMKQVQHIQAASKMLHESVYSHLHGTGDQLHVAVLDDEADDGSILDAVVESGLDPSRDQLKQIPRHIVDLWATRSEPDTTAKPGVHATYIAYTATPQSNLLQADQNPLAPRDFVVALRTPFETGELVPRSTTYREPAGLRRYYTGGEAFYRRAPLTVDHPPSAQAGATGHDVRAAWIADSLRSYLVAGAIQLWRRPPTVPLQDLEHCEFDTKEDVDSACPAPHSMLIHPSSSVREQFLAAAEVLAWGAGLTPDEARDQIELGTRRFRAEPIAQDLSDREPEWRAWLQRYRATAEAIHSSFDTQVVAPIPTDDDWPAIKDLISKALGPQVRIAVVNSDPEADDRPEFEAQRLPNGKWRAPRDLFTIFVSGNVMARGLTLEGLTTTLFLRSAGDPIADTQMQMQRWFGYRGAYLELCRVFAPPQQLSLFTQYHETDEALRAQIIGAMNDDTQVAPRPIVLEGERFRATAKIAAINKVPLCPGATPFVTVVNTPQQPDPNAALVADLFAAESSIVTANNLDRGRVLPEPLGLREAAELLEQLRYSHYAPDPEDPLSSRWHSIELQLRADSDPLPEAPLFRPPEPPSTAPRRSLSPAHCPYSIAAYLRLWDACLSRHVPGLFPTEDGEVPWSRIDLKERSALQPRFWVGLRFGSADPIPADDPIFGSLPFQARPMRRRLADGYLESQWGSRNPGEGDDAYLGDQLFDYHHHRGNPPSALDGGPLWRPVGAPGLILFHLVQSDAGPHPVTAVGVAIPLGGPDHFAARPRG